MTDKIFMNIITAGLILAFAIWLIKSFLKDFPSLLPKYEKYGYKEILVKGIKNKDIRKRLLLTLGLVLIYRAAVFIPLPGLDSRALFNFFKNITQIGGSTTLLFSSGLPVNFSIFSLGLGPFIVSCMLIQIFSFVIPLLKRLCYEREDGKLYLSKYAYIFTILLCLVQSYFIGLWLATPTHFQGSSIITIDVSLFRILTVLSLTSATVILLLLANIITRYGIGNGIGIIMLSNIIMRFTTAGHQITLFYSSQQINALSIIIFLFTVALYCWGIFYITSASINIPISLNSVEKINIPLRFSIAGTMPLILASLIYSLPATFLTFFYPNKLLQRIESFLFTNIFAFIFIEGPLIILFSYCYLRLLIGSMQIKNSIEKYNYTIAESHYEKILNNRIRWISLYIAIFLIIVTIAPRVLAGVLSLPHIVTNVLDSSGILVAIGVIYSVLKQKESKLIMADLDNEWTIISSPCDEAEATIKKFYLEKNNISCIIEPIAFTWGLPIKTAADEYRLYVHNRELEEAKKLLERTKKT